MDKADDLLQPNPAYEAERRWFWSRWGPSLARALRRITAAKSDEEAGAASAAFSAEAEKHRRAKVNLTDELARQKPGK